MPIKLQLSSLSKNIYRRFAILMLVGLLTACGQTGELERPPCSRVNHHDAV